MDFLRAVHHYAGECHGDQQRKYEAGPYIIHLERVRDLCKEYTNDQAMLAAALLHDVLEDTPVTKHEMKDHLSSLTSEEQAEMEQAPPETKRSRKAFKCQCRCPDH